VEEKIIGMGKRIRAREVRILSVECVRRWA